MQLLSHPLIILLCTMHFAVPGQALLVYPSPGAGSLASPYYTVTVGPASQHAFVYFTSRAGMQPVAPYNNVPLPSDRNTSFVSFGMDAAADAPVHMVVTCTSVTPTVAQIYPLRAAALLPTPSISGTTVTLSIDQPRQICLVINGITDAPLCVFADPLETIAFYPNSNDVIYFGPGTVNASVISVSTGQTVYLAPGAHVFGRIQLVSDPASCSSSGKGVAVRGRGVLDGIGFVIDVNGPSLIELSCSNVLIEGVVLVNSPKYQVDAGYPYTNISWVKAIAWGFSTDGYTGGAQSIIQNSFVKVNDDSIKPYATGTLVQNMVVWQMENGCAVMGSWNLNDNQSYITARTIDIIKHERTGYYYEPDSLLCFMHGGSGYLSNYLFEDIRVDIPGWAAIQLFVVSNIFADPVGGVLGNLDTIIIRNFSSSGPFLGPNPARIQGNATASMVRNIIFDNVTFNGVTASVTNGAISITGNPAFVSNITVCSGCSSAIVGADWTDAQKCSTPTSYCTANRGSSGNSNYQTVYIVVGSVVGVGTAMLIVFGLLWIRKSRLSHHGGLHDKAYARII